MSPTKYVYDFAEGNASMKPLLGGKGANLAEMTGLGIPVPQGFTVTTAACVYYSANGKYPDGLEKEMEEHLRALEKLTGKKLGDPKNPLLLSVRSGAVFSMPGMMDTVLNLGLNDETVEGMAKLTGNPRFAYDSYRRFISMFGDVVMGVESQAFEDALTDKKAEVGAKLDTDLSADDLRDLTVRFKKILGEKAGEQFPNDAIKQMHMATVAVFKSWDNHRAKVYRRTQGIPDELGTAVNLQSMVFGNKGETSGTGVAFTRDPSTGENFFYGEFLMNAQTWWPACAYPVRWKSCAESCLRRSSSSTPSATRWRRTTATCRTWSSPSRTPSSSCCRPAAASALRRPPSRWPWTWWLRA
jgi:pyruvate,orthophosphate dikinase